MSDDYDSWAGDPDALLIDTAKQVEFDRRDTTDKEVEYGAANGHLMVWYEDEKRPGKPGRAAAWAAWHSPNCGCGGETLPDW